MFAFKKEIFQNDYFNVFQRLLFNLAIFNNFSGPVLEETLTSWTSSTQT